MRGFADIPHLASTFERAARQHPARPSVCLPGGRCVSYSELDDSANRLAGFLRSAGVGAGDRVGLILPKGLEAVVTLLASMKIGAAYVPADWTAPDARGRAIMSDCSVKALVLHPRCQGVLDDWPGLLPATLMTDEPGGRAGVPSFAEALAFPPVGEAGIHRDPDQLSYVLYTSGSTGVPKGVKISHRNALSFVDWCSRTFQPTSADRFSSHAPFHFDLSILDLHVAWQNGASVHLIPDDLGKNPKDLVQFAAERDLTVWYSTPSTLTFMLQYGGLEKAGWPGPRLALFAGEVFPIKHLRRLTEIWTQSRWFNLYGPTETNVCTYHEVRLPISPEVTDPSPIGRPCGDHTVLMIRDADGASATGAGAEGSLWVTGDCVFQGYWNRPELDSGVFEWIDGRRWYDTGDVVRTAADGTLVYVGRRDRMVKRTGYRIELGEIETALYRHPRIAKAAVVSLRDADQNVRIVACCTPNGDRPSLIEMKKFCHDNLPHYMAPDSFVWWPTLPLTSTGKIDLQAVVRQLTTGPQASS